MVLLLLRIRARARISSDDATPQGAGRKTRRHIATREERRGAASARAPTRVSVTGGRLGA
jgi:hypothetical protein